MSTYRDAKRDIFISSHTNRERYCFGLITTSRRASVNYEGKKKKEEKIDTMAASNNRIHFDRNNIM